MVLLYIRDDIDNQKLGKELKPQRDKTPVIVPIELQDTLNDNKSLYKAFKALNPGKQREYCDHIKTDKRDTTYQARLEKYNH